MNVNGPAIRAIRERTGLTVTELAKRVGCQQGTLSAIEKEDRRPSPDMVLRIAQELKIDIAAILRGPLDGYKLVKDAAA